MKENGDKDNFEIYDTKTVKFIVILWICSWLSRILEQESLGTVSLVFDEQFSVFDGVSVY